MRCSIRYFSLHKEGNNPAEYEDSCASLPHEGKLQTCSTISVAIADGASDSIFSAEWANLLVEEFVYRPATQIRPLQFLVRRQARIWESKFKHQKYPWYVEEKVRRGAFSTFLGIHIYNQQRDSYTQGFWRSIALGDSCLFQVRGSELIKWYPVNKSEEFGLSPPLLSTNQRYNKVQAVWDHVFNKWGKWTVGDTFILATDALSCSFLRSVEEGKSPFSDILHISTLSSQESKSAFDAYVHLLRESDGMKNDDVTCLVVNLHK